MGPINCAPNPSNGSIQFQLPALTGSTSGEILNEHLSCMRDLEHAVGFPVLL